MKHGPENSDDSLFSYRLIAYIASWHCDASCSHCFIPKKLRKRDAYSQRVFDRLINHLPNHIRVVAFSGGEPFLHPRRFLKLLENIQKTGRNSTVVTNGLWASKRDHACRLLKASYDRGLRGLALSLDDYHRPRIKSADVVWLSVQAKELGLSFHVKAIGKSSRLMVKNILGACALKDQQKMVSHYDLERVGSARNAVTDRVRRMELGHCMSAMEPMVDPSGEVIACCSTRNFQINNPVLRLGNVLDEPIHQILDRASKNYLLAALIAYGLGGVFEILGRPIPKKLESRCDLCVRSLNDSSLLEDLSQLIEENKEIRKEIAGRMLVYETCYKPDFFPGFD